MIDTLSVKMRIIRMAISGELTERPATEPDIKQILKKINEEYLSLLKDGETKKKKEAPMIEEGLFAIPESWGWVPLGQLCILLSRGKSPKYSSEKMYPVFAQKCNQPNGLALEKAKFLDKSTLDNWASYFRLRDQDVVINSTGTGTMGRVGLYTTESLNNGYPFMLPDSHITVARFGTGIIPKYVFYVMRSIPIQAIMERQFRGSTNQKEFYIESVYSIPIPLPSTSEQEEIVSKLDKAIKLLDHIYETQKDYRADFDVLKSKIIDAGIKGELTEQLPEDGTAEELYEQLQVEKKGLIEAGRIKRSKEIPDIDKGDEPFQIPVNWKWVRWGSTSHQIQYGYNAPAKDAGRIKMLRITDIQDNKVNWDTVPFCDIEEDSIDDYLLKSNNILFARTGGTVGKSYLVEDIEEEVVFAGYLIRTSFSDNIDAKYMKYFMESNLYWKQLQDGTTATAQPNCNAKTLSKMMVPLPPKPEQKRIVERIDALLAAMPE